MQITTADTALLRLLQISSASLPVGAYAFSQGLEYATESGWVNTLDETHTWLDQQIQHSLAWTDLPIILRVLKAMAAQDVAQVNYWNHYILACRETKELSLADTATGEALVRLLKKLDVSVSDCIMATPSFVTVYAQAAFHWRISKDACLLGFLWSWLENQVAAATKLVPLGQSQAQQLLDRLQATLPQALATAKQVKDADIGASLPALSIASARHETQYTRLFRS